MTENQKTMITKDAVKARLTAEERAVSPVIGVILMVAITVILAAVIGTFVLDIGQNAGQSAPQASLAVSSSTTSNTFTVEHTGGDSLADQETRILLENESSGESYTIDVGSSTEVFSVGQNLVIGFNTSGAGNVGVHPTDSDVWTTRANATNTVSGGSVGSGNRYTITLIDTNSQRQIFETTITA